MLNMERVPAHSDNHCQTEYVTQQWKRLSSRLAFLASHFQGNDILFPYCALGDDIDANLKNETILFHNGTHSESEIIRNLGGALVHFFRVYL